MEEYYTMTEEREKKLWDNALIVFDTNIYLNLYRLPKIVRDTFVKIIKYNQKRFFVPAQVWFEYKKHRLETIDSQLIKYKTLPDFKQNTVNVELDKYLNKVIDTDKNQHEHIDDLEELTKLVDEYKKSYKKISEFIKAEYNEKKEIYEDLKTNDNLNKILLTLQIGKEYSYQEKMEIAKEGKYRYSELIPPGYEDAKNPDKYGLRKYGDLIIWKEILKKAAKEKKSVIFVTNDSKKDWYETENMFNNIITPRLELIQEFQDTTGEDIWIYPMNTYTSLIKKHYKEDFYTEYDVDESTFKFIQKCIEKLSNDYIKIKCSCCGKTYIKPIEDFSFMWEECGWSEREMGTETIYESDEYFVCPYCECDQDIIFSLTEYPKRSINDISAEGEKCKVLELKINNMNHLNTDEIFE